MTKLEELQIESDDVWGTLLSAADIVDYLVNEGASMHCNNMTYKQYEKLKYLNDNLDVYGVKNLPKVKLDGASRELVNTFNKLKENYSYYKRLTKRIDKAKKAKVATKKVVYKPKGTVVEKRETKLQNTSDDHYKFWNIKQLDKIIITEWGAIGTVGESLVKNFDTVNEATTYFYKKEAEKFKKGYYRV